MNELGYSASSRSTPVTVPRVRMHETHLRARD